MSLHTAISPSSSCSVISLGWALRGAVIPPNLWSAESLANSCLRLEKYWWRDENIWSQDTILVWSPVTVICPHAYTALVPLQNHFTPVLRTLIETGMYGCIQNAFFTQIVLDQVGKNACFYVHDLFYTQFDFKALYLYGQPVLWLAQTSLDISCHDSKLSSNEAGFILRSISTNRTVLKSAGLTQHILTTISEKLGIVPFLARGDNFKLSISI